MPDKIVSWLAQITDTLLFAVIGGSIGLGQALRDRERDTPVIIGRAICTGGLAAAAGVVLIWVPALPLVGQIGVAALLASLGTSGLERMAVKYFSSKAGGAQ